MAEVAFETEVVLRLIDQLSKPLESARKQLGLVEKSTERVKKGLSGVEKAGKKLDLASKLSMVSGELSDISSGLKRAISTPIKEFAKLDQSLTRMASKAGIKKFSQEYAQLEKNAETISRTSKTFSKTDVVDAQTALAAAGLSVSENMKVMAAATNAAVIENADLQETADALIGVMKGYRMPAEEAARVTDVLANASDMARGSFSSFAEGFKTAGPIASALKRPIEETAAALAVLDNNSIQGAEGGTALRIMLARMVAPTKIVAKEFKKLGITLKENGEFVGMEEGLRRISKGLSKVKGDANKAEILKKIFEDQGMTAANILLNSANTGEFGRMQSGVGQRGTAEKKAADATNNLVSKMKEAETSFQNFKITLGAAVSGPVTDFMKGLTEMSKTAGTFAKKNPEIASGMIKLAAGFTALIIGLSGVTKTIVVFKTLGAVLGSSGAFGGAVLAAGSALGAMSLAIVGVGGVLYGIDQLVKGAKGWKDLQTSYDEGGLASGVGSGVVRSMIENNELTPENVAKVRQTLVNNVNNAQQAYQTQRKIAKENNQWFDTAYGFIPTSPKLVSTLIGAPTDPKEVSKDPVKRAQQNLAEFDAAIQAMKESGKLKGEIKVSVDVKNGTATVSGATNSGVRITPDAGPNF